MYPTWKIKKKEHACDAAAGVENWVKMAHLPQQQRPLLEILYIILFSVMALHYHRLYQGLNLEAEVYKIAIKQFCRSYTFKGIPTYSKTNNQDKSDLF